MKLKITRSVDKSLLKNCVLFSVCWHGGRCLDCCMLVSSIEDQAVDITYYIIIACLYNERGSILLSLSHLEILHLSTSSPEGPPIKREDFLPIWDVIYDILLWRVDLLLMRTSLKTIASSSVAASRGYEFL